jgi:hypothetical protein
MLVKLILTAVLIINTAWANPFRVSGSGDTESQAAQSALRSAVEQSRSVMLTESQVSKNNLERNDIISYSSAYVEKYQIISKENKNQQWVVTADVWVNDNTIADRIIGKFSSDAVIDGKTLTGQADRLLSSKERTAKQGLQLLNTVLADYPIRAFTPTVLNSQLQMQDAGAVFVIKYDLQWSNNFLTALKETLSIVQHSFVNNNCANCYVKITKNWLGFTGSTYEFKDREPIDTVRTILNKRVNVAVSFYRDAQLIHQECRSGSYDFKSNHQFLIGIDSVMPYTLELPYQGRFKQALQESTGFKLSIVNQCGKI